MSQIDISFTIPSQSPIHTPLITLPGDSVKIRATLRTGSHLFTSEDFCVGFLHLANSGPIDAKLTFQYDYDASDEAITVCGIDYPSAEGLTLITTVQAAGESCIEYAHSGGLIADLGYRNTKWNYHAQLLSGVRPYLRTLVRAAHDALLGALRDLNLIVAERVLFPAMDEPLYHSLCTVLDAEGLPMATYDPEVHQKLEHGQTIGIPESSGAATFKWPRNVPFANVLGSTDDPKPVEGKKMYWMDVWAAFWGLPKPTQCSSYHFEGFKCNEKMIGGHVIKDKVRKSMPKNKKNNDVYLIPICRKHNASKNYMEITPKSNNRGLRLKNYFGPSPGLE